MILYFKKKLFTAKWFQYWCVLMSPAGFIAVIAGWFVTEIGRQPYTVYGVLRTSHSISPVIGEYVALSLMTFVIAYSFIFGAGVYYIFKLIKKGPPVIKEDEQFYAHSTEHTFVEAMVRHDI